MKDYEDPEEALRDVHSKFEEFRQAWEGLVDLADRQGPGGLFSRQVEAYKPFVRDQGMGDDPYDWFKAAAEAFDLVIAWGGPEDYPDNSEIGSITPLSMEDER